MKWIELDDLNKGQYFFFCKWNLKGHPSVLWCKYGGTNRIGNHIGNIKESYDIQEDKAYTPQSAFAEFREDRKYFIYSDEKGYRSYESMWEWYSNQEVIEGNEEEQLKRKLLS